MVCRILAVLLVIGFTASLSAQSNLSFELKNSSTTGLPYYTAFGVSVVQGDFNNDSKPDFIAAPALYLGNGDGTFQAPRTVDALNGIAKKTAGLAAADFNRDGNLDLAALTNQTLYVFYGNGDGTFQAPQTYTTAETGISLAVGDFNRDGYPDIAIGGSEGSIQIVNNESGGNFVRGNMYSVGGPVWGLAAGDVNANGDIALAAMTDTNLYVLWGDGHSDFHPVKLETYEIGQRAGLSIGDLNQDGNADIIASLNCGTPNPVARIPYHCMRVDVYYGQGNEKLFYRPAIGDNDVNASAALAADINGDGFGDLVSSTCEHEECGLYVWLGHPDGSFDRTPQRFLVTTQGVGGIVPGDFNRDGMIDFVSVVGSSGALQLYLNSSQRAPCGTSRINPTVTVCQPVNDTYVTSPVRLQATTYDKTHVTALQEYVDYDLVYSEHVSSFNITLPEAPGRHLFVTKAWDASGGSFRSNRRITVFNGTPGSACYAALGAANICLPAGTNSTSPVHILANGSTSDIPKAAQIYIDGNLVINDRGAGSGTSYVDTYQKLSGGSHRLVFKLWDGHGNVYEAVKNVNVH